MRTRLAVFVVFLLSSLALAQQVQQRRVVRPVNNANTVRLQGTMHPRALAGTDRGAVAATMPLERMTLVFSRTAEQQAVLDQLLADQQDPNSTSYHKWLTPEEFGDRFGLAQADIDVVSAWLTAQGFKVEEVARARDWIAFSGVAAQVEAAFHAPIHNYVVAGETHFAPSTDLSIPDAFAGSVSGVTGLHNFAPKPRNIRPHVTSSITGNHFVVPGDLGTIYNLPSYSNGQVCTSPCLDGTGQTIAIVGQTQLSTDAVPGRNGTPGVNGQQYDLVTFRNLAGLPPVNLTVKVTGSDPGVVTSDVDEANLDVEWAGAAAPNASLIFYIESTSNGGNGAFGAVVDAVNDNKAQVISVSYGVCEAQLGQSDQTSLTNAGQKAQAQGQAIVVASGDSGAADCDSKLPATHGLSVDFPSSMPYSTSIGGTTFTGDTTNSADPSQPTQYWAGTNDTGATAFSYIPETAWNDPNGSTPSATGGGASVKFTKPAWQAGPGVPGDGARDVPDISLNASPSHDGTVICSQSSCVSGYRNTNTNYDVIGGTSVGTPQFAGILALANQALGYPNKPPLGNPNQALYQIAANTYIPSTTTSWAFNDITTGNNVVACTSGTGCNGGSIGYSAGPGYDLVTGLGSIDSTALINLLAGLPIQPNFYLVPQQRAVSVTGVSSSTTDAIAVLSRQGMTGNVQFSCSLPVIFNGETCAVDPSSPIPGSANLTIVSGLNPTVLGTFGGTVTVQATAGNLKQSIALPVSVTYGSLVLTAPIKTLYIPPGGSASTTITLTSSNGFADTETLSCVISFPCSMSPSTVVVPPNGSVSATLTVTAPSSAAGGNGGLGVSAVGKGGTVSLSLLFSVSTPDFTLAVDSPNVSIPSGGMITDALTITPVSGFTSDVALTCSVPSSLGTTTCTISPTTVTGGSGSTLVTIKGAVLSRDRGAPFPFQHRGFGGYATLAFAIGMVLTTPGGTLRRRTIAIRRRLSRIVLTLIALCLILGMVSCGGGNNGGGSSNGPTPLTGNLTITTSGGGVTHTTTINVTVQ
jgi:hypothetical protein